MNIALAANMKKRAKRETKNRNVTPKVYNVKNIFNPTARTIASCNKLKNRNDCLLLNKPNNLSNMLYVV